MTHNINIKVTATVALAVAILALTVPASAQRRGGGGGGGSRQSAPPRQAPPRQAAPPTVHARRDGVRTNNFVTRTQGGSFQKAQPNRQTDRTPPNRVRNIPGVTRTRTTVTTKVQEERRFTKTAQGRHYDNGLNLRKGAKVTLGWQKRYFPHGYVHFPFYRQRYVAGSCFYSPFSFYFGICVPFIDVSVCSVYPPSVVFVDQCQYNGNNWAGFVNADDGNMINDPDLDQNEPGLNGALDELTETFQNGNIDGLASLVAPNVSVAVFLRGRYQYTLSSNNYVDLTRDAISSMTNVQFGLNYLHQRSPGVFCVSGQQTYQGQNGQTRTVYVSYVLQDISGQWTLTQVDTAPDIIQGF